MSVPFYKPFLPDYKLVEKDFQDAYKRGMLAPSVYTDRMTKAFEDYLGVKHAVAFSNCSDAMMCLVGYLADLTGKDKVIIPGFTFAATWQAVDWNGLVPVVVDVDEDGLTDPDKVEDALKLYWDDVVCVLGVHLWGRSAHSDRLEELALKYKTHLIYDAAHGIGTKIGRSPLANNGLAEVFSLGTTKTLAAGEGGLITTNDDRLAEAMRRAAQHGHKFGELDVEVRSLNGRIQEINSIIAYHSLSILEENIDKRQKAARFYNDALPDLIGPAEVRKPWPTKSTCRSYKDYNIFLSVGDTKSTREFRDKVRRVLDRKGIGTKAYYDPAVSDLFSFDGYVVSSSNARKLAAGCISLPFFTDITLEQQQEVVDVIKSEFYD